LACAVRYDTYCAEESTLAVYSLPAGKGVVQRFCMASILIPWIIEFVLFEKGNIWKETPMRGAALWKFA
jgi:hypothetical protein